METFEWIELAAFAAILFVLWDTRNCLQEIERQLQLLAGAFERAKAKD